jgi:hypothetical protein
MRTLREWMGHREIKTTMINDAREVSDQERELVKRAFGTPTNPARSPA